MFDNNVPADHGNCNQSTKPIYIVLSTPSSKTGQAIHLLTRDTYTHAAIAFDESISEMYSFGRRFSRTPIPGRIKKESLDSDLFSKKTRLDGMIISLPLTEEQYEKVRLRTLHMYGNKQVYKYNYLGACGAVLNIGFKTKNRFTCSQFVAYILEYCDAVDFKKPLNLIKPQDLISLGGEVIFSGNLKEYSQYRTNRLI